METLSPWATRADVEGAPEALKADIAALREDLQAIVALLTEQRDRRRRGSYRRVYESTCVIRVERLRDKRHRPRGFRRN